MRGKVLVLGAIVFALASCGGGGSGGGSSGVVPPPSPAPVPPPPPPPPPTAAARVLSVATGPSFFNFYADETFQFDANTAGGYGTREGEYFPNFARAFQPVLYGPVGGDLSNRAKSGQVIDANTGTYARFRAPAASKIISPLTSLLLAGPSQAKLKRQLGVNGSVFGLQAVDPDILTFDPVAESLSTDPARRADAARLLAANARAMAIAALQLDDSLTIMIFDSSVVGAALAAAPDQFLFNSNADMTSVVAAVPGYAALRPDVQSAIAHLINAYAAAVPVQITDADQSSRYLMGIIGYLAPQIRALRRTNSATAASAAMAITAPQISAAVDRYSERIAVTSTGFFFPAPDHYEMLSNSTLRLVSGAATGQILGHPLENDLNANGTTGAIGFFGATSTITSVAVPAINATQVAAILGPNDEITITSLNGFTGLTYFDYTVRHPAGESRNARIFVRVR
jgi:hypothetical protein